MLRTQGSAQVRAATAQAQGWKWILVSKTVVCDYIGYFHALLAPLFWEHFTYLPGAHKLQETKV
jgi:hypothetical protein